MTDNGFVTGCGFMAGNGNVIAVVEKYLPDGVRCQLHFTKFEFAIYVEGREIARFPIPHPKVYALLQGISEIGVVECRDSVWPDVITNVMDVVLLE